MKIFILLTFLLSSAYAKNYTPKKINSKLHKDMVEMITGGIYEQLYKKSYKLVTPVSKKISVKSINKGKRGKLIIEELKQRNREKLAIMRGVDPRKVKKGSDIVKMQKEDNKELVKKINTLSKSEQWKRLAKEEVAALKQKVMVEHKAWRKKHLPTLKEWEKNRKKFLSEVDNYKNNLEDIPLVLPVSKEEKEKKVELEIKKEYFFVPSSLALYVRDQKSRPTCSSFAGLRAAEVLLAQNNKWYDLSEQYFYWASKPNCRNKKCSEKGSWVGHGLTYSKDSKHKDIPLEKDCPYQSLGVKNNETQIPLQSSCSKGKVKVGDYNYTKTLDGLIDELHKDRAVITGIKLTPNFYRNKGVIFESEKNIGPKMDEHASGHTVLIVGYIKLPKAFDEGSVCFVINNSWGSGWGNGGYSCASEKWFLNHRNRNPFVSITSVLE